MRPPVTPPMAPAWTLVQLADLVRRAEQQHLVAMHALTADVRVQLREGIDITVSAAEIQQLTALAAESAEIAEHLHHLAQALPCEDIEVSWDDVREVAAAELAEGIIDADRALLAARVLDVATGWPALAEALRVPEIPAGWHSYTPRAMLSAFRGAGSALVTRALTLAETPPNARFANCSAEQLTRLADAIDELARGLRP